MVTEGEPTVSSDGITLTKNGKTMYLSTIATGTTIRYRQWSSDPSDYSSPLSAYDEANPGTYIVGFEATVSKGRNAIFRVTLSPDKTFLLLDAYPAADGGRMQQTGKRRR